jgi:integrase
MAISKRGDIWYIDYYAGGKRHKEAVGPKKKDAEAALGKIKNDIREGKWFPRKIRAVPFEELADEYERLAKAKKGYNRTEKAYIAQIRGAFKERVLSDLTGFDVERYKNDRKETPTRSKRPRSGAAVNRELACLRAMLNKAVQWEMIEKNPAAGVKIFPESPGRNNFLTTQEAGRLLDACLSHLRPIVLCALETGMRRAEILGLRWPDIRNGQIYLAGERTKNGKPREIPVSATFSKELERLKSAQGGGRIVKMTEMVFQPPRERKRLHRGVLEVVTGPMRDIRGAWETAKKKAGIAPCFRFHDLRHTFASHQKMAGVDDFTLMEIMGHSDHRMMRRYAHLTPEHKRKAIEMLPAWDAKTTGPKSVPNEGVQGRVPEGQYPQAIVFTGTKRGD